MLDYLTSSPEELQEELLKLQAAYDGFVAKGLALNMARGKPGANQLDLSMPMLDTVSSQSACKAADGTDCRNYGVMDGLPEAKELMASMLDDEPENVIVYGNSSLNAMHDTMMNFWAFGTGGHEPWCKLEQVKWLCPVPGYDRHFAITQELGIEMIPVPLTGQGPDMDIVEAAVAADPAIKGIWCVPQYSNPTGETYSPEVVQRLASMETAAPDFRIIWDNAYAVHHLHGPENRDKVADIAKACAAAGNPQRYRKFASTSKVTLPGAGVAAMAACPEALAEFRAHMTIATIGFDKINQLRHVAFLRDAQGIEEHMAKHAEILEPKFAAVLAKLDAGLTELKGAVSWTEPRGGYFVSFTGMPGTAKRIVELAKGAGVVMTGAGATWPLKQDPQDSNIRIAPTLPPIEELEEAMEVFTCCVKLASAEKLLG